MKIIPAYLPQFHQIPENDKWWGTGFTEWVNVKRARPLFDGHDQPRIPLNCNYYDLSNLDVLKWQCKIAKEHGIYGFSMYHYWFNGHLLLEKPMEMLLAHSEIDFKYCICWANHDWTNAWDANNGNFDTLISHNFDDESDWVDHFNYLLPFFKDPRYISENNKPLFVIYIPQIIGKLTKMLRLWDSMAKENGFSGLTYLYQCAPAHIDKSWDRSLFKYGIQFEPDYVLSNVINGKFSSKFFSFIVRYSHKIKTLLGIKKSYNSIIEGKGPLILNYDEVWDAILTKVEVRDNLIPSAYVDWDNTPRKNTRGSVHIGASPDKFKLYFEQLVKKTRDEYHQDKIFVFAWNEWAEGAHLEPDTRYGYAYLEATGQAIKNAECAKP